MLMLPTIDLDLAQTCTPGLSGLLGWAFAYYFDKVVAFAQGTKKSLDRVLTEHVLWGLTERPVKSKALFWFSATKGLLFLTVCDIRQRLCPPWMGDLTGYMECGSSFVHASARPFLYWDGNNLTRVYPPPGDRQPGQTYLCDLGSLLSYYVGPGEDFAVDAVRAAHVDYTAYSIVPEEPEEIITIGQRKCVLSHAFYNLQYRQVKHREL